MSAVEIVKYNEESKPPFMVYVWDSSETTDNQTFNLGNLHVQKVGLKFREYINKLIELKRVNDKDISLNFKRYTDANELIDNISKINPYWKARIPIYKNFKIGVLLGVDPELSDTEVEEGLQMYKQVLGEDIIQPTKTIRIKKKSKDDDSLVNTTAIKIYVREENLPKVATMWFSRISVKPYIPPIRQCHRCYRLGHLKENCRNIKEFNCFKCGEDHEAKKCTNIVKCINCKGPHDALYKECIARIQESEINKRRVYDNISYKEARQLVKGNDFVMDRRREIQMRGRNVSIQEIRQKDEGNSGRDNISSQEDAESEMTLEGPVILSSQQVEEMINNSNREQVETISNKVMSALNLHLKDEELLQKIINEIIK